MKHFWSKEEVQQLRDLAATMSAKEIARAVDLSYEAVAAKMSREGLERSRKRNWKARETVALRASSGKRKAADVARALGRSRDAVAGMAKRLGVSLGERQMWSSLDDARLRDLAPKMLPVNIAAVLKRSDSSIRRRAKRLGVLLLDGRKVADDGARRNRVRAERERAAVKKAESAKMARMRKVIGDVRVEYCPQCYAPVSDWQGHYERMGHRRSVAA
jgi:hypothetical protein